MASKQAMSIWYQRERNSHYRRLIRQSYWNELCLDNVPAASAV